MNQVMDLPSVFDVATAPSHFAMIERDVMGEDADERIDNEGQAEDDCMSPIIEDIGRIACAGCPFFSGCLKPKAVALRELKQADGDQLTDEIQHEDTGDTILLIDETMLVPKASYIKELLDEETEVVVATYEPSPRLPRSRDQKQEKKSSRRLPQKPPADKPTAQRATLRREVRQETPMSKRPSLPPQTTMSVSRVAHDEAPSPSPIKEDESRQDARQEAVTPPHLALPRSESSVEQSVVDADISRPEQSLPRLEQPTEASIDEAASLVQKPSQQSSDESMIEPRHVTDAPERVMTERLAEVPIVAPSDPQPLGEHESNELRNTQSMLANDTAESITSDPEPAIIYIELTAADEVTVSTPVDSVLAEEQIMQLDIPVEKAAPRLEIRHEIQHDSEVQLARVEDEADNDGEMLDDQDEYELADEMVSSDSPTTRLVEEAPWPIHDREVTPEPPMLPLPPPMIRLAQPLITPPVEKVFIDHVDSSSQTTEKPMSSPPPTEQAVIYREIDADPMTAPLVSLMTSEQIDTMLPEQSILMPPDQSISAPFEQGSPSPNTSAAPQPQYRLPVPDVGAKDEDQPIAKTEILTSIVPQPLAYDDAEPETHHAIESQQPPAHNEAADNVTIELDNPEHKQATVGFVSTAIFGSIQLGMVAVWLTMTRLSYARVTAS